MNPLVRFARRLADRRPIRIVALGSSSTEGAGASSQAASYPALLQDDLAAMLSRSGDIEVLNKGVGGEDAIEIGRRLDRDALALSPDLVILQTGVNDALRGDPIETFEAETRKAILASRNAGADVLMIEPQWCPVLDETPNSLAYLNAVRKIGEELEVPVVRRWDLMHSWIADGLLTREQMLASDGLHMADGGYALLARSVAEEILRLSGAKAAPAPALR